MMVSIWIVKSPVCRSVGAYKSQSIILTDRTRLTTSPHTTNVSNEADMNERINPVRKTIAKGEIDAAEVC